MNQLLTTPRTLLLALLLVCCPNAMADIPGLVGYWPLDEGSGNVAEELSGKGNAGRILGDVAWKETERGMALRFDGKTTVRVPDSPAWNIGPGELTFSLWVKFDQPNAGDILEHAFDKKPGVWVLHATNPPNMSFYDDKLTPGGIRFPGFTLGEWQHLALVWRRAEDGWMTSYVNGARALHQTAAVTQKRFGDLFIGSMRGYNYFKGQLKEVALFNRALSAAEIQSVYKDGIRLASPVGVSSLTASKVLYDPKEPVTARVRVRNVSDAAQSVELVLQLVSGLDDVREVHREALELPPESSAIKEIDFAFAGEAYGCELRALVEQGGEVLSAKSEYFSVTDNLWKVCIGGGDLVTQTAPASEARIKDVIEQARQSYCNWFEKFFWASDDWGDLTPEPGATWFSGQARRHENTDKLKLMVDTAHEHGMRAITYGKNLAGGTVGWELARRQPQWFLVDLHGRTQGRPATVWDLDNWHDEKYKYDDFSYKWTYRFVDLRRLDALDHGIDELIGSTKQFGWDGVRFDSSGFRVHLVDGNFNGHDAVNTRNMKRMKERLRAVYPDYLFGFNTNNNTARIDNREYPLEPEHPMAHEMRELLAGGGLWMGEGLRDWNNGGVHYTSWSQFAGESRRCIRTIKHYGGHFCYSYGLGRGLGKAHDRYKFVIGTMTGAHQYGMDHTTVGGSEHWGQFLTRWSGLVWHDGLRPLDETEKPVTVRSDRPVWWKGFANELVIGPNRRLVIVNLLNPPLDDTIAKTKDELPAPVEGCRVTLKVPRGQKLNKVFFISPGSPNQAHALEPTDTSSSARVSVPAFDVWAMVVYELAGKFTPVRPGPNYSEPLSAAEQAELKRTTPTPMDKPPGFGNWPPAPTATIRTADDLLNPTPQHHPAAKVRDFGKAKVQMPTGLDVGGEPGPDALIVKGFYHRLYRLPEAIKAAAPKARIAECTVLDAPTEYADLFKYDVVILADMGADAWDADGHQRLADYVEAGGRLVVLGGPFTLGQGYFKGTALARVLPVEVRTARDIYRLPEPLALGRTKQSAYRDRPLLYYYHAVRPKTDAKVRLWAGKLPVLLERKVGKGKVLVFTGTVLGGPQNQGETPFWEWDGWPAVLGRIIL